MLYYRYRPLSELAMKELMYNEVFLASTDECNDPYDSKTFYEFSPNKGYWENLLKIALHRAEHPDPQGKIASSIAEKFSSICPISYEAALKLDNQSICREVIKDPITSLILANSLRSILETYKPGKSYFACFSKSNNDPLMWSHYASQHQGFCLIFRSIDGELKQQKNRIKKQIRRSTPRGIAPRSSYGLPEGFRFEDIIYKRTVHPLCGFHRLPVAVVGKDLPENERITLANSQREQFLQKHISWEYEQESRISITPNASWLFGEAIELSPIERLFHYEPSQLAGIIFGSKTPETSKSKIMEIIRNKINESAYAKYERVIFDFVVFNATLSNTSREIRVEADKILTLTQEIDSSSSEFQSKYTSWQDGWGIKISESSSTKVQIIA